MALLDPISFKTIVISSSLPSMARENRFLFSLAVMCRTILFPKCDENIALNLKFHSQQPKNVRRFLFPKIIELMKSDHAVKSSLDSCLSRTLCYILPFCALYAFFTLIINKHADPELEKRILVMNITEQPIHDYMQFMNCVFCYRTACPIDICQLYNKHSPFLKRVAKLSNGLYVKAPSSKSLFGLLSYYFLADTEVRNNIIVPTENIEPMKVTCSCHGKPIQNDIAYVCTVCLSILCSYHDHCPIHQFDSSV